MLINLTIVGGCFPVQNNIPQEYLYHRFVKKELEERYNAELKINIIRYERFAGCFEKIEKFGDENNIDVLLFHIRAEQFLRICKLYYKYSGGNKNIKRDFNIPLVNRVPSEKKDLLMLNMPVPDGNKKKSILRKYKICLNLIAGIMGGNKKYALKKYEELIDKVIKFCEEKKIKLIIAGPASRPDLNLEDKLTGELNLFFKGKAEQMKIPFINLTGYMNEKNESLFFSNGIHVSEAGHKRAADFLTQKLKEIFFT